MPTQRDYYEVLGVAKDANQKAIKDAFRTLALKYHPDRNKDPGAEERFKEIAEAYAILSDPKKRADYDSRGFAGVEGFNREDLFGGIDFDDIFGGMNFDFGGDLFDSFFHRRRQGPAHSANIEIELHIPLERVASGGDETVHLARPAICHACHGTGCEGGAQPRTCATCKGSGRIMHSSRKEQEHLLIQQIVTCPDCHGRGNILEHPCAVCQGSGQEDIEETLTVKIPQGAEEGMALRIPGKGMPAPEGGGTAGDLFVVVRTKNDTRFERSGSDLLCQEKITLTDAVLGTTLTVPMLATSTSDSTVNVDVPPGTQPNTLLRIKDKGLPEFGSDRHGDLYLRITVQVPEKLSLEERKLYERLRALGKTGY